MTAILGISAFYHDSAAALLVNGEIVAAAQEERFTRKKHDAGFPANAISYVLAAGGFSLGQIDHVAFYDKPFLKFERLLETYVANAPRGLNSFRMAMPVWLREKLFLKDLLTKSLRELDQDFDADRLLFSEHHYSHAASAYFPSPFEEAIVMTLDGVGEWATTTVARGKGNSLEILKEIHFPHSLGLLYSAFTYYCGFRVNSGEYKLMGLAPYGEPRYSQLILDHLIDLKVDGSFRLDQSYFNYATGLTMTNHRFEELLGRPTRQSEAQELQQFHMDVAASIQAVTEEVVLKMTRSLARETGIPSLCLAGGVALNCVANGKILQDGHFSEVWVQPAAGDAGGALGAALAAWHRELGQARIADRSDSMQGAFLGPEFSQKEIDTQLTQCGAVFETIPEDELIDRAAEAIASGKAVGWFQGRMEFGPRALGSRSILGDARSSSMQKTLNLKVKYRESFRPFAPSVLREKVNDWFELDDDSPYMLLVAPVHKDKQLALTPEEQARSGMDKLHVRRSEIPAVTHVDYSARIQTVHRETNPTYHRLISRFHQLTGCPVIVNTSFNIRGEPIVCNPSDAFGCFMGTELDVMCIGRSILKKDAQDENLRRSSIGQFELD